MKIVSHIGDQSFEIDLRVDPEQEGKFIATVDGKDLHLDLIEGKRYSSTLSIDGKVGFFEFHRERGKIDRVIHDSLAYKVDLKNEQQDQLEKLLEEFGSGKGGTATATTLKAPMPGKILGINVKVGDRVELGQVALVLEAMKMENEISSTVEGIVKAIPSKVGDNVQTDAVLIEVHPPE